MERVLQSTDPSETNSAQRWAHRALAGTMALAAAAGVLYEAPADATPSPVQNKFTNPDIAQVHLTGEPITIATYNLLGSNHVKAGLKVGGSVRARTRREANTIKGVGPSPHMDIVGGQEVQPDQKRMELHYLSHYGAVSAGGDTMNTIFFDKWRVRLLGSSIINYPYYGDRNKATHHGHAVEARLQDKQTKTIYDVIDTHYVAWNTDRGSDAQGAQKRLWTAKIMAAVAHADARKHPNDVQIMTADTNADFFLRNHPTKDTYYTEARDRAVTRNQLPDCVLTKEPWFMQNAYYPAVGQRGHCPINKSPFPTNEYNIDDIYYSTPPKQGTGTYVVKWERIDNNVTHKSSDHDPVVVTAQVGHIS